MIHFVLKMIGGFKLNDALGQSCNVTSRKAKALLAYLAWHKNDPIDVQIMMCIFMNPASHVDYF